MYLSPSGFALEEIEPEQWIEVDIPTGDITDIGLRPSSEVLMHLYGYRKEARYRGDGAYTSIPLHCLYVG